jgi:hypothetical protein
MMAAKCEQTIIPVNPKAAFARPSPDIRTPGHPSLHKPGSMGEYETAGEFRSTVTFVSAHTRSELLNSKKRENQSWRRARKGVESVIAPMS